MAFDAKTHYLDEADRLSRRNGAPAWLSGLRSRGARRFAALGLPTTRLEEWKETPLTMLEQGAFNLAPGGDALTVADSTLLEAARYRETPGCELVFVDGHYDASRSRYSKLPAGAVIMDLAEAIGKGQPGVESLGSVINPDQAGAMAALATALLSDGVFIQLPAGARMTEPIHLVHIATAAAQSLSAPRILIAAGANSELTVVETYLGAKGRKYFTCAVTEILLGDNAVVHHYKDNRESDGACHIATIAARLSRDSRLDSHSLSFGGALTRNDISVELAGAGAGCALNGLYFAGGSQHVDHHTTIDHAVPHGTSDEFYKGIMDGESSAVFNGRVIVRINAQKSDAHQANRNLLLSKSATVNTNPQLEILADDVKCAHGATIGQLNPDALFYLRARGIGESAARDLLTYAFASEVVERIKVAPLRERLDRLLLARLPIDLRLQKAGS
jgi:Fe-S cluster assembly protein SufD